MKNISYLLFTIVMFFICFSVVDAASYSDYEVYTIQSNGANVRDKANSSGTWTRWLNQGDVVRIYETITSPKDGCTSGIWHRISDKEYVCSTSVSNIKTKITATCQSDMEKAGFPSSYHGSLCYLKSIHPAWNFTAVDTKTDWKDAVNAESNCGLSYVSFSSTTVYNVMNGLFVDRTCKNPYTSTWYPASSTSVGYYMDPRNWLNEKTVFQFEYLKYDNNLNSKYNSAVTSIINGTKFYDYHGNTLSGEIVNASKAADVSPIFIGARIYQELGTTDKLYDLYSGTYSGYRAEKGYHSGVVGSPNMYKGYYNFFNYGVSDSCATTYGTSYCGMDYAYAKGWNSVYKALNGGASSIATNYISVGQYNIYFQKYNIVPTDKNKQYIHQYMTNIGAPSSEAKTVYSSYNNLVSLNNAFSFHIPVYSNMDSRDYNSGSGGDGDDTSGKSNAAAATIAKNAGYSVNGNYIKITAGVKVDVVKSNLEAIAGTGNIIVRNASDKAVTSGKIGTGFKVLITNTAGTTTYTVAVKGDTSGDGEINALDLLQVQKYILKTYKLSGAYYEAGDTSGDGEINALDLLQVQKSILKTYTIS